jgi:signal transduction histidine kinase
LEQRVEERTRELQATAARLQSEVTERAAAEGRTRELLSRLITVQEEERRRIALNIHDDLGQQVSGLRIGLSLWETSVDPVERAAQAARVQQLARDLDHSIDFLTSELHPAALDHLGISAALAELVRRWTERFGIAADYHAIGTDDLRLAADLESNLYRLVQEALHNIYKHAGASQVDVVFSHRDGHAVLMVEDDGRGFAPEQPSNHAGGLGLVGMKERAMLAGGQFDIESSPGAGTTVHVRLPYGKRPDEEPAAS